MHQQVDSSPPPATYASAIFNPPPHVNPKLAAKEGIKARQFLLLGVKESVFRQYDTQKLKAELNKVLQDLGFKDGKIRSVISQKGRGTLIKVDYDAAAVWFANSGNSVKFCSILGDEVAFKTRAFNVLAFNTPLTIIMNNSKHREEINKVNGLEENTILAICWAKPANRRLPNQWSAHLALSFSNPVVANRIISSGITICNKKCHAEHMKWESIRCLRCQGWNHLARDCVVMISKCSNFTEHHTAEDCNGPHKKWCVSCNVDGHASCSRECPTFLRKVEDYNLRNSNNLFPFFPTSNPWTWSTGNTNVSCPPSNQTPPKINSSQQNKQQ